MAKLSSTFKYSGTFQDVTVVRSRAYGEHIRKARTKFTLSEEMKASTSVLKQANVYAKAFKDAIDPYRRDFRDGKLWQRLVSLFKTQLAEEDSADFKVLEGEDLNKIHWFGSNFSAKTEAWQTEGVLKVRATTNHKKDPTQGRADGYHQTLIVLFMDSDLQATTFSESTQMSLVAEGIQESTFTIPDKSTTAIVVMKCCFSKRNELIGNVKAMGMKVVKVVGVG